MTIIQAQPLKTYGITGPTSSLDNEVPVFDGVTGKKIKAGSGLIINTNLIETENKSLLISGVTGDTPVSGAGTRMMWIPGKKAFRAGGVWGDKWDDANVGVSSFAVGVESKASGQYSACLGYNGEASATYSTHFGRDGVASGAVSTHFGRAGILSGSYSTHFGRDGVASGHYSTHFGYNGVAGGEYSTHFGYNGVAGGEYSTHFGYNGEASGHYSTHFGRDGVTGGVYSIVGGRNMQLTAAANRTFVFGYSDLAVSIAVPDCFLTFPVINSGKFAIGTVSPATSAVMDLTSTTGALLLTRMTTTERDALTAINGMIIYNNSTNKFQGYENGAWTNLI